MDDPADESAVNQNDKNDAMPVEQNGNALNINGDANGDVHTNGVNAVQATGGSLKSEEKIGNGVHTNGGFTSEDKVVVMMTSLEPKSSNVNLVPEDRYHPSTSKRNRSNTKRQFVQAFSLYTNVPKLLSTKQGSGSLTCLNGIRVLSMSWVILGHTFAMFAGLGAAIPTSNILDAFKKFGQFSFQGILNGTYSVDTFFLLSGLLVTYLYLKKLKKDGFKPMELGLFYFHRLWRLTPLYLMALLCYAAYFRYINGPISGDKWQDAENCRKYWWRNILYINNFFKLEQMCMGATWYLANDWQMYVIAPLVILPLFYKPVVGLIGVVSLVATHIVSNAVIYSDVLDDNPAAQPQTGDDFTRRYVKPWARVAPFAVGMLTGYILYKTKCKICIPKVAVVFLWLVSIGLCVLVTYVQYSDGREDYTKTWDKDERLAFQTMDRVTWSVAIAWIILACSTGHGGVINSILSWPGWVPLVRLTYGAYLIHLALMGAYLYSRRTLVYYTDYTAIYHFLGDWSLSYGGAFILSVAFESPMMTLEKILISALKRKMAKK